MLGKNKVNIGVKLLRKLWKKSEDFGFVNGKTSAYTDVENSFF